MRKLATIRTINDISPIDGADAIELATVDGWKVVTKKGEFSIGDPCMYFEIDSFLPVHPRFEFLRKSSFKKMGDQEGFRLRTVKLRGQISQGLVLPITEFPEISLISSGYSVELPPSAIFSQLSGQDFSDILNIQKYEPPVPVELAGQIAGNFPAFIKKTDQERCQNLIEEIFVNNNDSRFEVTMKLDGTSFTGFYCDADEGACGRNWRLKINEDNKTNTIVRMFVDSGLQSALRSIGLNYAVQGELMGPGIQKNREEFKTTQLFVFDVYDIDNSCYLSPHQRHEVMAELWNRGVNRDIVHHVPVLAVAISLNELNVNNVDELLKFAEGPSINNSIREGLVFKRVDGGFSFKTISNHFLLKSSD